MFLPNYLLCGAVRRARRGGSVSRVRTERSLGDLHCRGLELVCNEAALSRGTGPGIYILITPRRFLRRAATAMHLVYTNA